MPGQQSQDRRIHLRFIILSEKRSDSGTVSGSQGRVRDCVDHEVRGRDLSFSIRLTMLV